MFRELFLSIVWGAGVSAAILVGLLLWIYIGKKSWFQALWIIPAFPVAIILCGYLIVYPSINYDIDCHNIEEYLKFIQFKDRYIEVPDGSRAIHGSHSMSNWEITFSLSESDLIKYLDTKPHGIAYAKVSEDEVSRVYGTPIAPNGAHLQYKVVIGENIVRCSGTRW